MSERTPEELTEIQNSIDQLEAQGLPEEIFQDLQEWLKDLKGYTQRRCKNARR